MKALILKRASPADATTSTELSTRRSEQLHDVTLTAGALAPIGGGLGNGPGFQQAQAADRVVNASRTGPAPASADPS